ncbi:MAG: efflux RND transporter permease subunit [Rubrimonas sp.]|uniref:efflux RND transporter permease subunit n=1 Tax=Rubrimonas sp. TaxID=2036015 RepID=UPI002FDCDBDB
MTGLISWVVDRARMIAALAIFSVVAGLVAYVGLPKEGSPNIDIPVLYVSVGLPGVSATDAERLLVKPMEAKVQGIEGLKKMTGIASEGHASLLLEFDFDWDKTKTLADVRALIDEAKAEMPDDALEPTIKEVNLSALPILIVSLSGDAPQRAMQRLAKDLQREIEALKPVLEAGLAGEREELVEVLVDPLLLEAYDVTASELLAIVSRNNRLVAAGAMQSESGRFAVKLPGNFQSPQEILQTPVRVNGDRIVTIGDIATIRRTFDDAEGTARFNGAPTVALQVKKRTGENLIDTVDLVKATVERSVAAWPSALQAAVSVAYSMDESRQVKDMVRQLEGSVMLAVTLVIAVVVLTLGARSALLVGLSIPLSFLLAFALLGAFGMTVNNMVMFGLILAVGMLVDGGIVVAEYADRRLSEGAEPDEAYAEAARRMFWPIVSSTATTLSAFLPMLFWPGVPGQFMGHLPITLIFVLSASLIVALIYLPVIGGGVARVSAALGRGARGLGGVVGLRSASRPRPLAPAPGRTLFGRVLSLVVTNPVGPFLGIAGAVAAMIGVFAIYSEHGRGVEFFVDTEPERAIVHVRARGNLALAEKDRLVRAVESRILSVEGVEAAFAFAGSGGLEKMGDSGPKDAIGQIQIELAPWGTRPPGDDILAEIGRVGALVPGVFVEIAEQADGPEQGKPIQIRVEAEDWERLLSATAEIGARLRGVEGLVDVDDTLPLPGIDWEVRVDREAAGRDGADIETIGAIVQLVTRGALLDTIRPDDSDEEIDIRVRFPADQRLLSTLRGLNLRTEKGLMPLGNFIEIVPAPALAEITRLDGRRFLLVKADVAPGVNVNERIAAISSMLAADPIPGVITTFQGDQEEQAESQAFLMKAFAAALGLMFAILLAQFNSLYNSVLVLSAVVMSFTGVMIGMMVMDQTFSIIMTGTGVVALAGIVVNNNIVLIDTYREFSRTMPPLEAILRTGEQRIRPVLLTTITTMAGLAPMMFTASIDLTALGAGLRDLLGGGLFTVAGWAAFRSDVMTVGAPAALWWAQLATAVVFGLGSATVLTLVVTPAALAARVWFWRGVAALGAGAGLGPSRAERALRRWARRTAPPDILWDVEEPPAPPRVLPPRAYADAAE